MKNCAYIANFCIKLDPYSDLTEKFTHYYVKYENELNKSYDEAEEIIRDRFQNFKKSMDKYHPGWIKQEVEKAYNIKAGIDFINMGYKLIDNETWFKQLQDIYNQNLDDEETWDRAVAISYGGYIQFDMDMSGDIYIMNGEYHPRISKTEFLRRKSKFKMGDLVTQGDGDLYVVMTEQGVITELESVDYIDCLHYALEGIYVDGHYSFHQVDSSFLVDEELQLYTGEVKEKSIISLFQKIAKEEYPGVSYILEDRNIDTGYNPMISYEDLFKWYEEDEADDESDNESQQESIWFCSHIM